MLHNATSVPSLSSVPLLLKNLSEPIFQFNRVQADTDSYNARLLRSSILSPIRSEQAVSVYNVAVLDPRRPFPNGTLTLTLLDDGEPQCAGFFDGDEPCNSNGVCTPIGLSPQNRCRCEPTFTPPTCTESFTNFTSGGSNEEFDASEFGVEPSSLDQQYVVVVRPFQTVYVVFDYSALDMETGSTYGFAVRILRGTISTDERSQLRCEIASAHGTELPDWTRHSRTFKSSGDGPLLQANITFSTRGSRYMVALFANASHTVDDFNGSAAFAITTPRRTVPEPTPSRQRFLPQAMLPVCLSLIFVAGLAVLLVFWLDRRSGRNKMVDRLSEAELLRMYPAYVAEGTEGECPICLSDMQAGDSLRALRCEHHFHAECLDVSYLRATSFFLRLHSFDSLTVKFALSDSHGVDHLSDNHREPVCSRNRSCWGCLFGTSRNGDNVEERQGVQEPEELQSQEMEEQQQSLEPQPEFLHDGIRIAFPDRAHWPLRVRTASSTPRTQSTTHAMSETGSEDTSMHTALDLSFGSNRREQRLANISHRPP
ncbi:hypothetical protein FGB62_11g20 [Gracilaria domingensis]|nr:hypothetical protein FGB62_11g20 [Gracilaria domingensis]